MNLVADFGIGYLGEVAVVPDSVPIGIGDYIEFGCSGKNFYNYFVSLVDKVVVDVVVVVEQVVVAAVVAAVDCCYYSNTDNSVAADIAD